MNNNEELKLKIKARIYDLSALMNTARLEIQDLEQELVKINRLEQTPQPKVVEEEEKKGE